MVHAICILPTPTEDKLSADGAVHFCITGCEGISQERCSFSHAPEHAQDQDRLCTAA